MCFCFILGLRAQPPFASWCNLMSRPNHLNYSESGIRVPTPKTPTKAGFLICVFSIVLLFTPTQPAFSDGTLLSFKLTKGLEQRIGVADALAGLHMWILPNAFRSSEKLRKCCQEARCALRGCLPAKSNPARGSGVFRDLRPCLNPSCKMLLEGQGPLTTHAGLGVLLLLSRNPAAARA